MAKEVKKEKSGLILGLEITLAAFKLFTTNEKKLDKKIIRQAYRDHDKLEKRMAKDGISTEERKILDDVLAAIGKAEIFLLSKIY